MSNEGDSFDNRNDLRLDPIEINIGEDLVSLFDINRGGTMLNQLHTCRREVASEMGFILPTIRVRDRSVLGKTEYVFLIDGHRVDEGRVNLDSCRTTEPEAVILSHFLDVMRKHAGDILTVDLTQGLLNILSETSPVVVSELVSCVLKVGQVHKVLQLLLKERLSIKRLGTILGTLLEFGEDTKDPVVLCEHVRQRLVR